MTTSSAGQRVGELNDAFRKSFIGGRVLVTAGVNAFSPGTRAQVIEKVQTFNNFTPENDPYLEHDFGSFKEEGEKFFWKIEYFDLTLEGHSTDASDPEKTVRVLTIMLASEY